MNTPQHTRRGAGTLVPALLFLLAVTNLGYAWAGLRYGRHWYRFVGRHRPRGIILHHSASPGYRDGKLVDVNVIDQEHAQRGWSLTYQGKVYHVGYHYVILADGTVQPGRPEAAPGAHTVGHNDYLGICLVGNFSSLDNPDGRMQPARPTEQQISSLLALLRHLMDKYDFQPEDLHRHRDFAQTACPGDRFPFAEVVAAVGGTPRTKTGVDSHAGPGYNASP